MTMDSNTAVVMLILIWAVYSLLAKWIDHRDKK